MDRIKTDKIFGEKNLIIYLNESECGYEEQMIRKLNNSNILSCKLDYHDGKKRFCYNINGLIPLNRYLEINPLSLYDIKKYLIQLKSIIELLESYMLGAGNIYLGQDGIYADEDTGTMKLCIVPENKFNIPQSEFAELLLQNINTEDTESLRFAFKIFKASLNEDFEIKKLFTLMEAKNRHTEADNKDISGEIKIPEKNETYNMSVIKSEHKEELKDKLIVQDNRISTESIKAINKKETKKAIKKIIKAHEIDGTGILVKILVSLSVLSVLLFILVMLKGRSVLKRILIPYFVLSAAVTIYHMAGYIFEKFKKYRYEGAGNLKEPDEEMYRLIPMDMNDDIIDVSYFPFIIGSGDGITDYRLQGKHIEAVHLRIEEDGENLLFTDMNTTKGIQIGSSKLTDGQSQIVKNGTEIMLGEHKYILQK